MSRRKNQKENILASAKQISLDKGLTEVDIRTVAKKSGISIGTIYNYFPSKAELMMSVIEDFWKEAFIAMEEIDEEETNLLKNIEYIYDNLSKYMEKFRENWLSQMSALRIQDKEVGLEKEEEYFEIIENMIIEFIDKDSRLDNYPWTENFSKVKLADFIFSNMFRYLNDGEENIDFLILILEKTLKLN